MHKEDTYIDENLRKVSRVDPPAFLFTRIEAKIQSKQESWVVRPRWVLAMVAVVIVVNVITIGISMNTSSRSNNALLSELNIETSNQLYYE